MIRIIREGWETFLTDFRAVKEQDPAARHWAEILFTYSGLHAICFHRIAHFLFRRKQFFLARLISQWSRFLTGIEIHPGAVIGKGFFIDHGMGVVIGETCEIGDHVTLYQGVTLGGTGKEKGKRHPTLGNHVMVSSGAKVLGAIQVGSGAKIGAGAVVLRNVPPDSTVVGVPGRVVSQNGVRMDPAWDFSQVPDPVAQSMKRMQNELFLLWMTINRADDRLKQMEQEKAKVQ
ncbi:serine O-acetyltransferase [Salinithrix halophila]|uniref:Serine acetyltransferase n=1 Tax=Salinithrix halophila TaxID=1485204 RepID=A0ABV8JFT5_9BACL